MRVIVHLSDIHFGRLQPSLVEPLATTITRLKPDLLAVSGDLTQRARRREFDAARRFLDSIPVPRLVLPGNHDVPLYNVFTRFATPLARYKRAITSDLAPVYRDDEMIVVGVNTARSLTWGEGRINEAQVDHIVQTLSRVPADLIRVVVTHHPFDLPEGVREERLVGGAAMAMERLTRACADLFLAGHLHVSHVGTTATRYQLGGRSALIVQAGTMSTRHRGELNTINVLDLTRDRIAVRRYAWNQSADAFEVSWERSFDRAPDGWQQA